MAGKNIIDLAKSTDNFKFYSVLALYFIYSSATTPQLFSFEYVLFVILCDSVTSWTMIIHKSEQKLQQKQPILAIIRIQFFKFYNGSLMYTTGYELLLLSLLLLLLLHSFSSHLFMYCLPSRLFLCCPFPFGPSGLRASIRFYGLVVC